MCRIDDLVGEIVFEVSKQITLRPRVEIETRFVQQQNRAIGFAVFGICREHDIEREKPLEATASFIKVHFNVIRTVRIGNQRVEMVCVEVEAYLQFAVLPPLANGGRDDGTSTVG